MINLGRWRGQALGRNRPREFKERSWCQASEKSIACYEWWGQARGILKEDICPDCHGTRLSSKACTPKLCGITLDQACAMILSELVDWVKQVPASLPKQMRPMAESICEAFQSTAKRLMCMELVPGPVKKE